MEEVTVGVDDVRLRELSLDERDDMGEFVFSTVCAIGDSVHGLSGVVCRVRVEGGDVMAAERICPLIGPHSIRAPSFRGPVR